jgi:hypothetical protein
MKRESAAWVDVELLDQLDDVVAKLRPADQQAILLRFYQQKTYEEAAMSLGISADACRKRLERAMVQLQGLFARRGVVMAAGEIAIVMSKLGAAGPGAGMPPVIAGTRGAMMIGGRAATLAKAASGAAWTSAAAAAITLVVAGAAVTLAAKSGTLHVPVKAQSAAATTAAIAATAPTTRPDAQVFAVKCMINARSLGQGIVLYANENRGQLPANLGDLYAYMEKQGTPKVAELFICPRELADKRIPEKVTREWIELNTSYVYLANAKTAWQRLPNPASILLYEKLEGGHERGVVALYADGHAEMVGREIAPAAIEKSKKAIERANGNAPRKRGG